RLALSFVDAELTLMFHDQLGREQARADPVVGLLWLRAGERRQREQRDRNPTRRHGSTPWVSNRGTDPSTAVPAASSRKASGSFHSIRSCSGASTAGGGRGRFQSRTTPAVAASSASAANGGRT